MHYLKELSRYRSLIAALVSRHLAVRYRGSVLGYLWSFLNPLCLMLVYLLVFKYYIRFEHDNYTIFLFVGLLPWLWVQSALSEGATSITSGGHLITKSMFPAHVLPAVTVITSMVHFALTLPLLFIFMYFSGVPFHPTLLLLPFLIAVQFALLHGLALFLGSLNVYYRDIQHLLGNLLTFLFFLCPILYPADVIPEKFQMLLYVNPFAVMTVAYHNLILDGVLPSVQNLAYIVSFSAVSVGIGYATYTRFHERFAEAL